MRQAGIIAAGAIYAIENNLERLVEDHQNAATLASYLLRVPGLTIHHPVQTNIVIADVGPLGGSDRVMEALCDNGVLCGVASPTRVRFVTHLDVSAEAVKAAGEIAARLLPTLVCGAQSG
jgi:threonine aldolase